MSKSDARFRPRVAGRLFLFLALVLCVTLPGWLTDAAGLRPTTSLTRLQPKTPHVSSDNDSVLVPTAATTLDDDLSADRIDRLGRMWDELGAGLPFTEDEAQILRYFAGGLRISELEADTVLSRALFAREASLALSTEQRSLLDRYDALVKERRRQARELREQLRQQSEAAASDGTARETLAPPTNDLCAGAEIIPATGPFPYLTATVDIAEATLTGDPPAASCSATRSRTVWYRFTPALTAIYTISSCSNAPTATTVPDTVITVYQSTSGCSGPFNEILTAGQSDGCDADSCTTGDLQAVLVTRLVAGDTYYIVVGDTNPGPPIAGQTSLQLRISGPPPNDTCVQPTLATLNMPLLGSTRQAGNDFTLASPGCFTGIGQSSTTTPGRDVVYQFTAPAAGSYNFRVSNYSPGSNLVLYLSDLCPATSPGTPAIITSCLQASNRSNNSTAEEITCVSLGSGQTVYLFVDEASFTLGSDYTLLISNCVLETEPNDSTGSAAPIVCGLTASINSSSDVDFYTLGTFPTGSRVFALVDGAAANNNNFNLRVTTTTDTLEFDDADNALNFGENSPNVEGTPLNGAAAFLRVDHSAAVASEPYHLYAIVQPPSGLATPEVEPNDTFVQATTNAGNYFAGAISAPGDIDVFGVAAMAADQIFVGLDTDPLRDNTPFDGRIELLDGAGNVVASVNDGNAVSSTTPGAGSLTATTPSSPGEGLVYVAPAAGTYYVRVLRVSGASPADYLLSIGRNCAACTLVCPANIATTAAPGTCAATVTFADPTTSGTCGTVSCSPPSGSSFPVGVTTVTCTTDMGGGCLFTVTVTDDQPPTLICPANITVGNDLGQCGAVVTFTTPTATDNCPGATTSCSPPSGSFFPVGTTSVTCTATDAGGNSTSCSFTVTINDTEAPVVTCPANITVGNDPGQCSAVVTFAATASDNCPGVGTPICTPASGSTFMLGTTSVTCMATDGVGNTASCTFSVTVNDTEPPSITCPANVTVGNDAGQCSAVVAFPAPTVNDNCPGVGAPVCTPASGSTFLVGTTTVSCTVNDAATNTNSCSFTVTVNDVEAPTVTCPANITVGNDPGQCGAVVAFTTPTATDNCPGATTSCSPPSGSFFPVGTTSVTCTATDASGNTANCTFSVTVNDTEAPVVTCPANITVGNDPGQCSAVVTFTATASDNCPGVGTPICTPASGSTFMLGTTSVTCMVMDGVGNTANCTFSVTVNDTEPPSITCPANVTVGNDAGQCSAVVAFPAPTVNDNCPGVGAPVCTPASGSTFLVGTTTVSCTVNDAATNTNSCSFTVTVNDVEAPTVTCPANITVGNDPGQCGAVVTFTTPTATDNCPGATTSCSPPSGSFFPVGTTSVTCTATDASGNTANCTFSVTVNDTEPPSITCPANITVGNDPGQCSAVVTFAPTVGDNCPGVGTPICTPASGSTFQLGTTTVTCMVMDGVGNTAACSFTVTVNDTEPPSITCPPDVTVTVTVGVGCVTATTVTYPDPTTTDNCPGAITVVCDPPSGSNFEFGTTTVTCTATDAAGNVSTCTFVVTVGAPFDFCAFDDNTNDSFHIVTDPTSPFYGYWIYHIAASNTDICGIANFVNHIPGVKLRAYDNDFSAENPDFFMDATFKQNKGTVYIRRKNGTIVAVLRDRDLSNDPPCS